MDQILKNSKVLVFCGTGGVGKTTTSAAMGIRAAQLGLNVLVLTIDPAQRLATSLGLSKWTEEEVEVKLENVAGKMSAAMVDHKKIFDSFVREASSTPEVAEKILANKIYRQLSGGLSGTQEFTSLERLYQALNSKKFDLIILDTPPALHANDFLKAPERFYSLFEDSVMKWFVDDLPSSQGLFTKVLFQGVQLVFSTLETLLGSQFMKELRGFFTAMKGIHSVIRDHSVSIQKTLMDPSTKYFLISSFDHGKLEEAKEFQTNLSKQGINLSGVIVNRAYPEWLPDRNFERDLSLKAPEDIRGLYKEIETYYLHHAEEINEFTSSWGPHLMVKRIPEFATEICDIHSLSMVAQKLGEP